MAESYRTFKDRMEMYLADLEVSDKPKQARKIILAMGDEGMRQLRASGLSEEDRQDPKKVYAFFDAKLDPAEHINYRVHRLEFARLYQHQEEVTSDFVSRLREKAKLCRFRSEDDLSDRIIEQLILTTPLQDLRKDLLSRQEDLTVDVAVKLSQHHEALVTSEASLTKMASLKREAGRSESVHKIKSHGKSSKTKHTERECRYCGKQHARDKNKCPAYGKVCSACGKQNHFAKMCRSDRSTRSTNNMPTRKVNKMNTQDVSSGEEWVNTTKVQEPHSSAQKEVKCELLVNGKAVTFQIDTGSSVNTLPREYATNIQPTTQVLKTWTDTRMLPIGVSRESVRNPKTGKKYSVEFVVTNDDLQPLIGLNASTQMKLVTVELGNMQRILKVNIQDEYKDVMSDSVGRLPDIHSLKVDDTVTPVIMPARRVPVALRPKLKAELGRLVELGVLAPVEEPTPWVNQMVAATKKDGSIRVCIDPRELNKALQREHYTMPVLDDVLHDLSESRLFTKADLKSGYWHVVLDEESSKLTTFQTCCGRYRWLRLPFGLSVSAEIFQRKLIQNLQGLPGVVCIADDVIIHGKNVEEHDHNLRLFLQRCRERGIRLNKDKLELRTNSFTFMGHRITNDGVMMDPEKVRAITAMPEPTTVHELRRFLGMVNYVARFLPSLAATISPLHNLLKKDVPWVWSETQQRAVDEAKRLIAESPTLQFYDPTKPLTVENDASEYGLGAALLQEGKPVCFASRTLTPAEQNYAQIEKEMLAITFGLEKFHQWTYGRRVSVVTDHKPLVAIKSKPLCKAPRRLQAMLLKTQTYDFELRYKPGAEMTLSDTLSRAPACDVRDDTSVEIVNNLAFTPFSKTRLEQIRKEVDHDEALAELKKVIQQGWPILRQDVPESVRPFFDYRDELAMQDGIILRGERIVIPSSMRREMLRKAHEGHLGINSCVRRARELIFWPGMSAALRLYVESCHVCAAMPVKQSKEPLIIHPAPDRPWQKVGTDIMEVEGRNYLITVDYYSKYFEVDFLADMSAATVIARLKQHCARYGIPDKIISDNGPQFACGAFKKFTEKYDIEHEPSSPGNSQANGAAEAAVKTAKSVMLKCAKAGEDPYIGLLNLRNTPHEGVGTSPAQKLLGRRTKTLLPTTHANLANEQISLSKESAKLEDQKYRTAARAAQRPELKPLVPGDRVYVQPLVQPLNKRQEWKPAVVAGRHGPRSYEVIQDNGHNLIRNRRFLRGPKPSPNSSEDGKDSRKDNENVDARDCQSSPEYPDQQAETAIPNNNSAPEPYRTRSGRVVQRKQIYDV